MRRLALVASLGTAACFNPDSDGTDSALAGTTGATATGATETTVPLTTGTTPTGPASSTSPASTTDPATTVDPATTATDPTDDTDSTTSSGPSTLSGADSSSTGSSSTTDFVPGCDNGVVEDDELCFEEAVELDTLVSSQGVVIADLDGDEHLDVVVGDYGDGTTGGLYVYLGNGAGSFSDAIDSGDDTPLIRVAAGAIADGVVDVIGMRATSSPAILRYRGNDDGSFSSISPFVGGTSWDVALADLNGDGRLDALGKMGAVNVLLANASENFGAIQAYGDAPGTQCVHTVDFDGDDDLDVLACTSAGIYPLTNDGDGALEPGSFFGGSGSDLMIGDFDGDGNADVASAESSVVVIHLGAGDGTFSAGAELTVNSSPIAGKASDMDNDGYDDVVVVNTSGTTSILMSNGDGTFAQQELFTMLEGYLYDMDMGDLNEDGVDDIVVVSPNAGPIQLLLSHI